MSRTSTPIIDLYVFRYPEVFADEAPIFHECLSDMELESIQNMKPSRAERFMFERSLTRRLIAESLDVSPKSLEFERLENGKPQLVESGLLHFNISHCKDLFVIGVSREFELGVDIERAERSNNLDRIAQHYFSDEEVSFLNSDSKKIELRFTQLWTVKESIIKLRGSGISKTLLKNATRVKGDAIEPNREWLKAEVQCCSFERDNHFLSVACNADVMPVIKIHDEDWCEI